MSDIYQSPGDRLRFEVLLKSLTEGNLNIAVLSKHDKVLDYYGRLFEERLLSKGEQHVEFCTSTNSEHLVQKFNEILSQVSLDEALEKEAKHAPRRYLIFRDSVLMQDFELQLLARLVNGFPAGNISVILLINNAGNYKNKVAAFGKNLLEWEVETQAGEAKEPLTDWVREEPVLEPEPQPPIDVPTLDDAVPPASKLLNMPTKTAWRIPGFGKKKEAPAVVEPRQRPHPRQPLWLQRRSRPWRLLRRSAPHWICLWPPRPFPPCPMCCVNRCCTPANPLTRRCPCQTLKSQRHASRMQLGCWV